MLDPDYDNIVDRITSVYSSLSVAEQKMMRQILEELTQTGYSYTYEQLFLNDFKEMPVGIDEFLSSDLYMGSVTRNGEAIYPYWRQMLNNLFSSGNKYNEIILSGSTRIGKTSTMVTIMVYMLYRLMLYRSPHEYFKKKEISRFTLAFANLTKDLAFGVAYREYQDTLKDIEWFNRHGTFSRSDRNFYYIPEGGKIDIVAGSDASNFLGMQIWACALDEVSFAKSGIKDIALAKEHMKKLYDTVNARISGTFRIGGEVYGKLIASSSKNQDNDFLADHIETQQKTNNEHLYLVDEPQWKVLPKSMFSDETFHFTVGDRYKRGFVIDESIDDEEHRSEYEKQGYQVIEAPAEFRKNFVADYDISLRDIAGISVAGAMGFITQESITPCVAQDRVNPFYEDILTIGRDDDLEISDFFHLEAVPQDLKYPQLNIHLDLAETHNRTGITGCCVTGNKIIEGENGKKVAMPFIKEVFTVAIEAPRGGRQSFQKVVNFIIWLRQQHFNVGTISTDQYQADFLRETLSQQGFDTTKFSVGMEAYIGLKNLLIDQRIELVKNTLQENELISTQRMNNKIHHPEDEGGGHGDIADSLAGSTKTLVSEQVTARPPARNLASIAAAVNKGTAPRINPMSSANTVRSTSPSSSTSRPVHFPKLR